MKLGNIELPNLVSMMVRAVRGARSQMAVSQRLGYSTNAVGKWETDDLDVRWLDFLRLWEVCDESSSDLLVAAYKFVGDPMDPMALLAALDVRAEPKSCAESLSVSPRQAQRMLRHPERLKTRQYLRLLGAKSWPLLLELSYRRPESALAQAVKRYTLESEIAAKYPFASLAFSLLAAASPAKPIAQLLTDIARTTGAPLEAVENLVDLLKQHGLVTVSGGSLAIAENARQLLPGTQHSSFEDNRRTKLYWLERAHAFVAELPGRPNKSLNGYLTFDASHETLTQIREELIRCYYRIDNIVRNDPAKSETAVLFSFDLIDWRELRTEAGSKSPSAK
jgi:hypothetical protein